MKFLYIGFRLPRFEDGQVPPFIGCGCFSPDSDPIPRRSFDSRAKGHPELGKKRNGLTTTCGCLFGFVHKKKPTYLERFISYQRRELSQRAPPYFVDGGSIN